MIYPDFFQKSSFCIFEQFQDEKGQTMIIQGGPQKSTPKIVFGNFENRTAILAKLKMIQKAEGCF